MLKIIDYSVMFTGLLGALVMALGHYSLAYYIWLPSNVLGAILGYKTGLRGLMFLQIGFLITTVLGLVNNV